VDDPTLYAVYLGGDPAPGRLTEDHEVVLVVATDVAEARRRARAKWAGVSRPHVDAVRVIDVIDGFAISLEATDRAERDDVDLTYEPEDG
jgi:Domain of Unknown Function (DUF1543)